MIIPNVGKDVWTNRHSDNGGKKKIYNWGLIKVENEHSLYPSSLLLGKHPKADLPNWYVRDKGLGEAFTGHSFQRLIFYLSAAYILFCIIIYLHKELVSNLF